MEVTASGNKMKTSGMSPKPDNDEMQDWRIITKRKKKKFREHQLFEGVEEVVKNDKKVHLPGNAKPEVRNFISMRIHE